MGMWRLISFLVLASIAPGQVASNFQASCSAGQITLQWTTLTKGRLFARVDADPPGVTWPPSPAFQQIETKDSSASFTVAPGSHVAYLTSLEGDGSWPMGPSAKLTCAVGSPASVKFSDAETPLGIVDGVNRSFEVSFGPNPAGSLVLIRNGLVQSSGVDYSLEGRTILFNGVSIPQVGDVLRAWYRY